MFSYYMYAQDYFCALHLLFLHLNDLMAKENHIYVNCVIDGRGFPAVRFRWTKLMSLAF